MGVSLPKLVCKNMYPSFSFIVCYCDINKLCDNKKILMNVCGRGGLKHPPITPKEPILTNNEQDDDQEACLFFSKIMLICKTLIVR